VIALEVLVGKIIRWDPTKFDELDRMEIVVPLLDIVRMENSGKVTGEALDVLNKLLVHGIFTLKAKNSISAVSEIAESLSQCKFEAMENGKDELVLNKLLNVQLTCIFTECGSYLTDHAIWEMFQTSFRIFSEMKPPEYSELLSDCAQHTLMEMTRIIFQRLKISEPDGLIPDRFHETNYDYHLQSFGIPCMIKVFSTLCTSWASKSKDGNANLQSSNSKEYVYVNTLILRLICCALEEAGVLWTRVPSLVSLVKDDVCALLLRSSKTNDPIALCLILRVFYDILLICRDQLKVQIEVIINSIYMRLYMPLRSPKFSHEERASVRLGNQTLRIDSPDDLSSEIVFILLDGLCNLCRLPNFYRELFLNYDCDPKCTNVFHNITKVFCQYAVPLQDEFSHLHEVALNGLMAIISSFQLIPSLNDSDELLEECNRILEIRNQKETLAEAIEVFNQNPKKGIAKLLESKLISGNEDAEGVANLLRFTFGFSKPKIGEFLGADDPFATQIRQKFIEKFDYRNRRIDEAVRMTIEVLELPKEAQQIDRIINAISAHFFEQNKNLFSNADVVYFLTFSLLMLHTVRIFVCNRNLFPFRMPGVIRSKTK
jgi:brefeldin A-resistance guanine nucleotide exchange factor 1